MPGYIKLNGESYGAEKVIVENNAKGIVLWENPNPKAEFLAQTVTLSDNILDYESFEIFAMRNAATYTDLKNKYEITTGRLLLKDTMSTFLEFENVIRGFRFDSGTEFVISAPWEGRSGYLLVPTKLIAYKYDTGTGFLTNGKSIAFDNAATISDSTNVQDAIKDSLEVGRMNTNVIDDELRPLTGKIIITSGASSVSLDDSYAFCLNNSQIPVGVSSFCRVLIMSDNKSGILEVRVEVSAEGILLNTYAKWFDMYGIDPSDFVLSVDYQGPDQPIAAHLWQKVYSGMEYTYQIMNTSPVYTGGKWGLYTYVGEDGDHTEILPTDSERIVTTVGERFTNVPYSNSFVQWHNVISASGFKEYGDFCEIITNNSQSSPRYIFSITGSQNAGMYGLLSVNAQLNNLTAEKLEAKWLYRSNDIKPEDWFVTVENTMSALKLKIRIWKKFEKQWEAWSLLPIHISRFSDEYIPLQRNSNGSYSELPTDAILTVSTSEVQNTNNKILWENTETDTYADFGEQTITLNDSLLNYDTIEICYKLSNDSNANEKNMIQSTGCIYLKRILETTASNPGIPIKYVRTGGNQYIFRTAYASKTSPRSLTFSPGFVYTVGGANEIVSNDFIIPLFVTGHKY